MNDQMYFANSSQIKVKDNVCNVRNGIWHIYLPLQVKIGVNFFLTPLRSMKKIFMTGFFNNRVVY